MTETTIHPSGHPFGVADALGELADRADLAVTEAAETLALSLIERLAAVLRNEVPGLQVDPTEAARVQVFALAEWLKQVAASSSPLHAACIRPLIDALLAVA